MGVGAEFGMSYKSTRSFVSFLPETNTAKKGLFMQKQTKLQNSTKPRVKAIPKFKSEAAERKFWEDAANDATEYFDVDNMQAAKFTNLKPTTTSISLRLSDSLLDGIRRQANKLDVPYQSLMKVWLTEKLGEASKRS